MNFSLNDLLIKEALSWVGTKESGNNSGEIVQMFQRSIGGANNEPWCMSFVQYCVGKIAYLMDAKSTLFKSESCMNVWDNTPVEFKSYTAVPGYVVIWRHGTTEKGHTGIVHSVQDIYNFTTVEGNTDSDGSREGNGVYLKKRTMHPMGDEIIQGFVNPWGALF